MHTAVFVFPTLIVAVILACVTISLAAPSHGSALDGQAHIKRCTATINSAA